MRTRPTLRDKLSSILRLAARMLVLIPWNRAVKQPPHQTGQPERVACITDRAFRRRLLFLPLRAGRPCPLRFHSLALASRLARPAIPDSQSRLPAQPQARIGAVLDQLIAAPLHQRLRRHQPAVGIHLRAVGLLLLDRRLFGVALLPQRTPLVENVLVELAKRRALDRLVELLKRRREAAAPDRWRSCRSS